MELKPGDKVSFRDHGTVVRTSKDSSDVIVRDVSGNNQSVPSSRILEKYALGGTLEEKTELLAREFSRLVRRDLTNDEIKRIVDSRNSEDPENPHDYMDANMTIMEAFINVMGRAWTEYGESKRAIDQHESDMSIMDNAQSIALKNKYYLGEKLVYPRDKSEVVEMSVDGGKKKKMAELGEAYQKIEEEALRNRGSEYTVYLNGKKKFVAKGYDIKQTDIKKKKHKNLKPGDTILVTKENLRQFSTHNEYNGKPKVGEVLTIHSRYLNREDQFEVVSTEPTDRTIETIEKGKTSKDKTDKMAAKSAMEGVKEMYPGYVKTWVYYDEQEGADSFARGGKADGRGMVDYVESIMDELVKHYMPGVEASQYSYDNDYSAGTYDVEEDKDYEGNKQAVATVYFGKYFKDAVQKMDESPESFKSFESFAKELAGKKYYDVEILTGDGDDEEENSDENRIIFVFTKYSGKEYAKGGIMKKMSIGSKVIVTKENKDNFSKRQGTAKDLKEGDVLHITSSPIKNAVSGKYMYEVTDWEPSPNSKAIIKRASDPDAKKYGWDRDAKYYKKWIEEKKEAYLFNRWFYNPEGRSYAKGGIMSDSPRIYVADLAAYNEGKLIGEWLDLSDYSSGEEVMEAIQDLLKKWSEEQGVEREEYAIHDTENIPGDMINEYSGEDDFEKVVSVLTVANDRDIPFEVILKWMNDKGEDDANNAADAYNGSYKDEEDFAYEMVQQGVISDLTPYLTMTETDRRILAGEESDNRVEDMDDDDLIREADMEDDLIELQEKSDKADNDEEKISEVKDKIEELESELTELEDDEEGNYREIEFKKAEIESAEEELAKLESEYEEVNFDREKDKIVDKAREKVRDQVYDEVYEALSDPVEYFVNEQGIYSQEDLAKASFMSVDYEYLARELGHDYTYIRHDGETYVFSDNYARGGKIRTPKPKKKKGMQVGSKVTIIAEKINELRKSLNPPKQTSVDKMLKNYESVLDKVGTVYEMGSRIVGVQYDTKKISILKEYLQLLPEEKNSFAKVGRVKDHSLVKVVESAKNAAKRDGYTMVVYRSDDELKYSFARKSEFERGISQGEPAVAYVNESGIVDYKYAKGGSVRGTKYPQFFEKFKRVSGYIGDPVANNAGEILFEIKPDSKSDFDEMVKYAKENKMEVRPNEINPKRALIVLKKEFAKGGLANHKSNVFIAHPYRKKYVVVDEKTNSLWANEYFTTEEEAKEFIKQNGLNLVKEDVQPFKAEYKLAKGGFANLEKIASGKYLDLAVQGNKLHIFLTEEGREWIAENGEVSERNFDELFDDIRANSELMYFPDLGEAGIAMSSAPGITDGYYYGDTELESHQDAKVWYFPDYAIKDAFTELNENGEVDFDLAPTFKKGGKVKFNDKVNAIASRLRGKGVPKKYRRDYGSRYDKDEAKEAARRIAGAQLRDSMGKVKKN